MEFRVKGQMRNKVVFPALLFMLIGKESCESESDSVMSQLFVTPWTVAFQAPLFIEFPRQEYWSG